MNFQDQPWLIEFHSGIPAYKQIVNHIQAAVAEGRLPEGKQLPTIRALHKKLKVNPNTVAKAYRELELKGIISAQRGSGCFVAPQPVIAELSQKQRKAKAEELYTRFRAEAEGYGLRLEELIRHINPKKSYV